MLELLNSALLNAAEGLVNGLIRQDPAARARLRELAGSRFLLRCSRPSLRIGCLVHEQGLLLSGNDEGEADCTIEGGAAALLGLLRRGEAVHSFHGSGVSLRGSAEKARQLQVLLRELRIDWEYALGQLVGDLPVHLAGESLRSAGGWLRDSGDSLRRDIDEYLHEEARLAPGKAEMEDFLSRVQALRLSVDRVAARVELLARTIEDTSAPWQP